MLLERPPKSPSSLQGQTPPSAQGHMPPCAFVPPGRARALGTGVRGDLQLHSQQTSATVGAFFLLERK